MGSTRLPGKVMMKVRNKPLLYYVINQTLHSKKIYKTIIATTNLLQDNKIVEFANSLGVEIYRGSELDVLDRYYKCAKKYNADSIVRITADCPLIDPQLIDKCITEFEKNEFDYFSNINKKEGNKRIYYPNGFPLGFAVEVFTFKALEEAWKNAKKPSEREHVGKYFLSNPTLFKIGNIENSNDYSDMRLTIDYIIDFDLIKTIIEYFPDDEIYNMEKIAQFLNKKTQLKQMNSHISFDQEYQKSLADNKIVEGKSN